jgi:hypothetical protein
LETLKLEPEKASCLGQVELICKNPGISMGFTVSWGSTSGPGWQELAGSFAEVPPGKAEELVPHSI